MNYLLNGGYCELKLEMLIEATGIRSEKIISGLKWYCINGASIENAAELNDVDAANLRRAKDKINDAAGKFYKWNQLCNKSDESKQVAIVTPEKPKRSKKPAVWKEFFKAYPEGKKGGVDTLAWKAAQSEKLTVKDFELMLEDVIRRGNLMPSWRKQYAQGVTRYIRERIWLTPITPERGALKEVQLDAFGHELRATKDITTQELISDRSWAD